VKGSIINSPLKSRAESIVKKLHKQLLLIDDLNDKEQRIIFLNVKKTFETLPQDLYDHIIDTHFANYVKKQHRTVVTFILKLKELEDTFNKLDKKVHILNNYEDE
jgi:hypothetical protein